MEGRLQNLIWLQQYLPFTVLKLLFRSSSMKLKHNVATVLTVYGIETTSFHAQYAVRYSFVATVLTVYGIETNYITIYFYVGLFQLQQYLPFTVLKLACCTSFHLLGLSYVATVLTVYGIETAKYGHTLSKMRVGCNSTYRLRY